MKTMCSATFWRRLPIALILTGILLAIGCSRPKVTTREVGDGRLTAKSWPSYYPRYSIELPLVSLDSPQVEIRLEDLPKADYEMYLQVLSRGSSVTTWDEWSDVKQTLAAAGTKVLIQFVDENVVLASTPDKELKEWSPGMFGGELLLYSLDMSEISLENSVTVRFDMESYSRRGLGGFKIRLLLRGGGFQL